MAAVRRLGLSGRVFRHNEDYLVVFIIVQSLVGIDVVVSTIWKF